MEERASRDREVLGSISDRVMLRKIYKWHQVSFEIAVNRLKQFFIPSFVKIVKMAKWPVQKLTHRTTKKNTYTIMTQQTFRKAIFFVFFGVLFFYFIFYLLRQHAMFRINTLFIFPGTTDVPLNSTLNIACCMIK